MGAQRELVLVLGLAIACAAACTSGSNDPPAIENLGNTGEDAGSADGATSDVEPDAGLVRAEFGLDERPSNTTCLAPDRPPPAAPVKLERVFPNVTLASPMAMAQAPGDPTRWFVAQRHGKIVSFPVASPPTTPAVVADLPVLTGKPVLTDFEGGFLGFAFHPKFATNGKLYISFTTNGTTAFASEVGYLTTTDGGASFTSYTKVLGFDRPRLEHCGGSVGFGKEGALYLSFGDGTVEANAQSKENLFGKIIRIDVDNVPAGQTYGIPEGNPFKNGGGDPAIFAWGFRNPFRFSLDRATNDVWVGDVGDGTWEEVDLVRAGGNYGWPCREGAHVRSIASAAICGTLGGLIDPVVEHGHAPTTNSRAVTGGVVYRGAAMPRFHGTYVYADFIRLEAWALSFDPATGEAKTSLINENGPQAGWSFFGEDQDGEIYTVATFQNSIHKLVPAGTASPSTFPDRLSKTGCTNAADVTKPAPGLIPFSVNAPLWSDGSDKERFLALPDGTTITVGPDGDFDLPIGTVLSKTFGFAGKRVETRLFVRHDDGEWAGYSYEWNDAQTDAELLPSGKEKSLGDRAWVFPSRSDCLRCHTSAAGRSLGLELGQLNGDGVYASTGRVANQLRTLEHIGMLTAPLGKMPTELVAYPAFQSSAAAAQRARAYLHANCSFCHRPEGGAPRATMDLRFATPLADTKACGQAPQIDDLGVTDAKLVAPGVPAKSIVSLRMHASGANRMPPLASRVVDPIGSSLVDGWIRDLTSCP